ncbi:hypothetical protein ACRALDRAFT_208633 [Sodiomyces alcalophilus JCM 7366]|uniref:uncharacterized protein n=1 Tax=Sodiomyces alcalophilus JCM 7366 TaxID=591952 RepID=UPI0039B69DD0
MQGFVSREAGIWEWSIHCPLFLPWPVPSFVCSPPHRLPLFLVPWSRPVVYPTTHKYNGGTTFCMHYNVHTWNALPFTHLHMYNAPTIHTYIHTYVCLVHNRIEHLLTQDPDSRPFYRLLPVPRAPPPVRQTMAGKPWRPEWGHAARGATDGGRNAAMQRQSHAKPVNHMHFPTSSANYCRIYQLAGVFFFFFALSSACCQDQDQARTPQVQGGMNELVSWTRLFLVQKHSLIHLSHPRRAFHGGPTDPKNWNGPQFSSPPPTGTEVPSPGIGKCAYLHTTYGNEPRRLVQGYIPLGSKLGGELAHISVSIQRTTYCEQRLGPDLRTRRPHTGAGGTTMPRHGTIDPTDNDLEPETGSCMADRHSIVNPIDTGVRQWAALAAAQARYKGEPTKYGSLQFSTQDIEISEQACGSIPAAILQGWYQSTRLSGLTLTQAARLGTYEYVVFFQRRPSAVSLGSHFSDVSAALYNVGPLQATRSTREDDFRRLMDGIPYHAMRITLQNNMQRFHSQDDAKHQLTWCQEAIWRHDIAEAMKRKRKKKTDVPLDFVASFIGAVGFARWAWRDTGHSTLGHSASFIPYFTSTWATVDPIDPEISRLTDNGTRRETTTAAMRDKRYDCPCTGRRLRVPRYHSGNPPVLYDRWKDDSETQSIGDISARGDERSEFQPK